MGRFCGKKRVEEITLNLTKRIYFVVVLIVIRRRKNAFHFSFTILVNILLCDLRTSKGNFWYLGKQKAFPLASWEHGQL